MIRIFLPLICTALGLATTSCSQAEGPFASGVAPASSARTSHGTAAAAMASPPDTPHAAAPGDARADADPPPATASRTSLDSQASATASPTTAHATAQATAPAGTAASSAPAEHRASVLIGMPVVAADGSPLGDVSDIIFDSQGQATHVVIAYEAQPQGGPGDIPESKPIPDGKLKAVPWDTVLARITNGRLVLDAANLQGAPSFTAQEWPNVNEPGWSAIADAYWHRVAQPALATHRANAIDSTARARARPTRDGD